MGEGLSGNVLAVCTANRCRSPMFEVLARSRFADAGLGLAVRSAGVLPGGEPATDRAVDTMRDYGLDLSSHHSRQLDTDLLSWADLVVVMERDHLATVAEIDADALWRSFVFGEVPGRIDAAEPTEQLDLDALVRSWNDVRPPDHILVVDPSDDLDDPIGRSRRHYRQCAVRLDEWLRSVIAGLTKFHA